MLSTLNIKSFTTKSNFKYYQNENRCAEFFEIYQAKRVNYIINQHLVDVCRVHPKVLQYFPFPNINLNFI